MALNLLDPGALGDFIHFLGNAFAGWRYVFSPSYRRRIHARWESQSQLQIAQDVTSAIVGCLFLLLLLCLMVSFFAGFDWIAHLFHGTSSV
jgi:hypothetical protein